MELQNIFDISTGYLKSRVNEEEGIGEYPIFTKNHFDINMGYQKLPKTIKEEFIRLDPSKYLITEENDIIIDSLSQKAAIITNETAGMFISFNYFILKPIVGTEINLDYFVAWFNLSDDVKKQLNHVLQGTVIKKLVLKDLKSIRINLPNIETQVEIGKLYKSSFQKLAYAIKISEKEQDIIKNYMEGL